MAWNPNFVKGVDFPAWDWLAPNPGGSTNPGCGNAYDGVRYIYYAIQVGTTTAGTASTSQLWRYDTWTDGWQFLATLTSGNQGMDLEYDATRNVLYIITGNGLTTGQIFNLNTTSITVMNVAIGAWALGAMPTLPAVAGTGSSLTMPDETMVIGSLTANGAASIDSDVVATDTASTTTSVVSLSGAPGQTGATQFGSFGFGMVGLYVRFTAGTAANIGVRRQITAVPNARTLTLGTALPAVPAAGDAFVVEVPEGTATGGSTTTLIDSTQAWTVNLYANSDVIFITGVNAGVRRRIASNTATTLTLAGAVTGNTRTGTITTPGVGDVYRIVPSGDFLYFQPGGLTTLFRFDVVQTTGAAWSASVATLPGATGGGANTMYAGMFDPFSILALRGAATNSVYRIPVGTLTPTALTTYIGPNETFTTGASAAMMHGRRRMWVAQAVSNRVLTLDLTTGIWDAGPQVPYNSPAGYDGHRSRYVRTASGVEWMYHMRAGGQEFFRIPAEWVT